MSSTTTSLKRTLKTSSTAVTEPRSTLKRSARNESGIKAEEVAKFRQINFQRTLDSDNLFEDPSKKSNIKTPDFGLKEEKIKPVGRASKRALGATDARYRKNFEQRRHEFLVKNPNEGYMYDIVTAPSPNTRTIKLCETCWMASTLKCAVCNAFLCQKKCYETHKDLRCNKLVR
uniref:HIT-type domain-containing protein n=1 Tax=Panagrolaimus sp. PS1159 TaxID=55785 RepID=A0AC35GS16_9BILA